MLLTDRGPLPATRDIATLVVLWHTDGLPKHFEDDLGGSLLLQGEDRIKLAGELQESAYGWVCDAVFPGGLQDEGETRFALVAAPRSRRLSGWRGGRGPVLEHVVEHLVDRVGRLEGIA
jgi:hypothetical protein